MRFQLIYKARMIYNARRVFLIWSKALVTFFFFSSLFYFGGGSPLAGGGEDVSWTAVEETTLEEYPEEYFIPGLISILLIKDTKKTSEVCSFSEVEKYVKEVGSRNDLEILEFDSTPFGPGECNRYIEVKVPNDQVQAAISAFKRETELVQDVERTMSVRQ